VPDAVAVHRRGLRPEEGRSLRPLVNLHSVKNRFLLRAHCADTLWHFVNFPWWLLRDVLVVGACLTVERTSLPALSMLWRLRRDAAVRRRWVLSRATASSRQITRWFHRGGRVEAVEEPPASPDPGC